MSTGKMLTNIFKGKKVDKELMISEGWYDQGSEDNYHYGISRKKNLFLKRIKPVSCCNGVWLFVMLQLEDNNNKIKSVSTAVHLISLNGKYKRISTPFFLVDYQQAIELIDSVCDSSEHSVKLKKPVPLSMIDFIHVIGADQDSEELKQVIQKYKLRESSQCFLSDIKKIYKNPSNRIQIYVHYLGVVYKIFLSHLSEHDTLIKGITQNCSMSIIKEKMESHNSYEDHSESKCIFYYEKYTLEFTFNKNEKIQRIIITSRLES